MKGALIFALVSLAVLINAQYIDINEFDLYSDYPSSDENEYTSAEQLRAPVYKQGEQSPEELADEFEGDMIMTDDQLSTGRIGKRYRWENGRVPCVISKNYNRGERNLILKAMKAIESKTCIKFVRRRREKDFIHILSDRRKGCSSNVGKAGNRQLLYILSPTDSPKVNCMQVGVGIIIHELIHALGFKHMQSALNRNKYDVINYNNIQRGKEHNFETLDKNMFSMFDTAFDYKSIMHYSGKCFSKNGKDTITTKNKRFQNVIGQRTRISKGDILRINRMYRCSWKL